MWRDPLDELIEDLERAIPAVRVPEKRRPSLKDIQDVTNAHLFLRGDELERWRADPGNRLLEETVMQDWDEGSDAEDPSDAFQEDLAEPANVGRDQQSERQCDPLPPKLLEQLRRYQKR